MFETFMKLYRVTKNVREFLRLRHDDFFTPTGAFASSA